MSQPLSELEAPWILTLQWASSSSSTPLTWPASQWADERWRFLQGTVHHCVALPHVVSSDLVWMRKWDIHFKSKAVEPLLQFLSSNFTLEDGRKWNKINPKTVSRSLQSQLKCSFPSHDLLGVLFTLQWLWCWKESLEVKVLYFCLYFEAQSPCSKALLNECLKSSWDYLIKVIGN